jgi:hypothetical protein
MNSDLSDNTVSTSAPASNSKEMTGGRRNTRKNRRNATRRNNMRRNNTRRNNVTMRRNEMMGGAKVTVGTKAQVWHGTAKHTSGGLKKKDLMRHKGKIVSRRKHAAGLKAIKRLRKLGYTAKKGTFKLFKKQK